jgi:hypothetical protein
MGVQALAETEINQNSIGVQAFSSTEMIFTKSCRMTDELECKDAVFYLT